MVSLFYLGNLLVFIGAIWLVIISIQIGKTTGEKALWAIVNFICQPLGGIIFYIMNRAGLIPLIMIIVGVILMGTGYSSVASTMVPTIPN